MLNQAILYGIEMLPDQDLSRFSSHSKFKKINKHDSAIIREKGEIYENLYNHLLNDNIQEAMMKNKKHGNYFNKFVIKIDSRWKAMFDNVMLIVSTYNTFTQAYIAAFASEEALNYDIIQMQSDLDPEQIANLQLGQSYDETFTG
jgi:hypothetical protein